LADPAPVFIASMLAAPQAALITLGRVTDEAGLVSTVSMEPARRLVGCVLRGIECRVAEMAFVLIQIVFVAIRSGRILKLRLTNPTPVLVPGMLGTPQAAGVALRGVAHEASLAVLVRVSDLCHIRCA
jgi:hypothetical protein